jgi:hypothetical protein
MTMKFNFEIEALGNFCLELLDNGVAELDHFAAGPAIKVIVVLFLLRRFIKSIAAGLKTLLDHSGLEQDRDIPVDGIARNSEAFFLKTPHKLVDIKMPPLPPGTLEKLETLPGHAEIFPPQKVAKWIIFYGFHEGPYQDSVLIRTRV